MSVFLARRVSRRLADVSGMSSVACSLCCFWFSKGTERLCLRFGACVLIVVLLAHASSGFA